ncbi:MAG: glycerol-3-phosphate dehydrogenase/oxidase [Phycisphaerales bacterium]|nr:glycerol-3-phosphate dehydrogenase/oxidase [Phycisphaerales bacterium]
MRNEVLAATTNGRFDVIVIGGGASGLGVALDAVSRGYSTLLLEQADFGSGTSSRSTKLVHGGVRYLQQGNISLVREALHERGLLYQNAPHLVTNLAFVVPRYKWWEGPFYGIGLKLYDLLAGKLNLAKSRSLNVDETLAAIPNLESDGLDGGTEYHDGQFDDARMCTTLVRTARDLGAVMVNRAAVIGLEHDEDGHVCGVRFKDGELGNEHMAHAKVVVNATGVFANSVRRMDDAQAESVVAPSRGVHLVLDQSFLAGDTAIMVPHTDDGRVLFVIPWHERCLVGTTDALAPEPIMEPRALDEEVEFILRNAARYLDRDPTRDDILCVFAGLRPLVRHEGQATKKISREHEVLVSQHGLVSIIGGKWTTYRKMADDVMDHAIDVGGLDRGACVTESLRLRGWLDREDDAMPDQNWLRVYGADCSEVMAVCDEVDRGHELLHERLPYPRGAVVHAARHEQALRVEDVLSRRTRALLLDARAAGECARDVAELLAGELGRDADWIAKETAAFEELAQGYEVADSPRGSGRGH